MDECRAAFEFERDKCTKRQPHHVTLGIHYVFEAAENYIEEAEDHIESLKRCGNCAHFFIAGYEGDESCDEWRYGEAEGPRYGDVRHGDRCHYVPSRWKEAE